MRVLRFEMTRAFRNKWLAVSIALGTLIGLADIWLNVSQYGFNRGRALIQTWIGTDYQFAYNSLFYVLLPLIACFPYAGSCYQDQKTGYESSICIKTSRLSYMIAKEAAVAASGAAAVACPLLIAMFIAAGIYPDKRPEKLTFLYAGIIDCHMFPRIFAEHPVCYALLFTLLDAVFGLELRCEKSRSSFQNLIRPAQLRILAFEPFDFLMFFTREPLPLTRNNQMLLIPTAQ